MPEFLPGASEAANHFIYNKNNPMLPAYLLHPVHVQLVGNNQAAPCNNRLYNDPGYTFDTLPNDRILDGLRAFQVEILQGNPGRTPVAVRRLHMKEPAG
ncbi:hypothetical protein D3C73_1357310 [compost metagenome]